MSAAAAMTATSNATKPWYREWWVWLVLAPPMAAVLGGIVTIVLAVRGADGVVVADYYKRGLEINASMARTQLAATLGIEAAIDMPAQREGHVTVALSAQQALPADATLTLRFVHPARSEADRVVMLARINGAADGRAASYVGTLDEPLALSVAWRVALDARDWRVDGDYQAQSNQAQSEFVLGAISGDHANR